MRGGWNKGNDAQHVYPYVHKRDEHRIGDCNFKPEDGDLCLCVEPSGDYFDNYVVIRKKPDGRNQDPDFYDTGTWRVVGEFGAYVFGISVYSIPTREFHLLMAGEMVQLPL